MKVNSFIYSNTKRDNPYSIHQQNKFQNYNMVEFQEPINDYCRPISIFNSQFSSRGFNDHLKYQQVEISESSSKHNDDIIINNQLQEHIIDQPIQFPFKDSSIYTKEKISSVFTNADSKSNYSKEINEISRTGSESHIQGQDSALLSILLSNNEGKGSKAQKNCTCPHRHSIGLNTKELIRITNQRKKMLNQLEEKEKKRRNSHDPNNNDLDQYNDNNHEKEIENELDNCNFEEDPVIAPIKINKPNASHMTKDENEPSINFSSNLLKESDFKVDKERVNKHNEEEVGNLEFLIENRSDEDNKNNSYNDEYLFSQNENDPYKATNTTQKEIETEINELDIEKNRKQNETKIMLNSNDTSPFISCDNDNNKYSPQLNLNFNGSRSPLANHESLNLQIDNLIATSSPPNQLLNIERDQAILQKLNFFEETLKKIEPNEDIVISNDMHSSNPSEKQKKAVSNIKYDNNRYDKRIIKKDKVIPHPIAKVSSYSNKPTINKNCNSQDNKQQVSIQTGIENYKTKAPKRNSDNQSNIKQDHKANKKKRYASNYSELYTKKSINDSGILIANQPMNKALSTKIIIKSNSGCDILQSNKYLYSNQRHSQKSNSIISSNHITRNKAEQIVHYETSDVFE